MDIAANRARHVGAGLLAARVACALAFVLASGPASAGSSIVLPYPDYFGDFPAVTYDDNGERVGEAFLSLEKRPDGLVFMSVKTSVASGASTEAHAELEILEGNSGLRLLREFSHSHNHEGESMGVLRVDHVGGEATCTPTPGSKIVASKVSLPKEDRVTNVPLQLLFLPLVKGETERISFQLFLCGGGAKLVEFAATVAPRAPDATPHVVEIRYRPELGSFMSFLAKAVVPDLAFWFDSNGQGTYLAHRMPLFTKGPEVTVVREGVAQDLLTARE